MKNKVNLSVKDIISVLTNVIPITFSMAVCSGFGAFAGAVYACIASLIFNVTEEKQRIPLYVSLLIITFTFKEYGISTVSVAIVVCGILIALSGLFYDKLKDKINTFSDSPVIGAVMISCAITTTIIFTTDYFGIGATGNTAKEMIASYLSLGFHPNWRGVLYGTIVMVVMITFPRKFKKATKIINASFIALIIATLLNLFLNPSDMITAIREAGTLSFDNYKNILFPVFNSELNILYAVINGFSLFLTYFFLIQKNDKSDKTDFIACGITGCLLGFASCMPVPTVTQKENLPNRIIASLLTGCLFLIFNGFIARIPVHACAVVLIVGVWQSVKWSEVKGIFTSLWSVIIFLIILISGLFGGYTLVPLCAFIGFIFYSFVNKSKHKQ